LEGERDDVGGQSRFVIWRPGDLTLRRTMLAEHAAGEAFRNADRLPCAINAGGRGLKVSRRSLLQDQLLKRQMYKLIFDLTDGMSWPMSFQAALLSSMA